MTAMTDSPSESLVNGWRVAGVVLGERSAASCQDRASFFPSEGGLVIVVADGVGGVAGGSHAADFVVATVGAASSAGAGDLWSARFWVEVLRRADAEVVAGRHGGESTAVVLAVGPQIVGASVGDSVGWLIGAADIDDLTAGQDRRPMVGSGRAAVTAISGDAGSGTLVVASDGFAKYAPRAKVAGAATDPDLPRAVERLVNLARLRSGALQDDVAVMLCRRQDGDHEGP
jgi:serine/threonine protein phosphatase PrpC